MIIYIKVGLWVRFISDFEKINRDSTVRVECRRRYGEKCVRGPDIIDMWKRCFKEKYVAVPQRGKHSLKEFFLMKDVICDFYLGENIYNSTGELIQRDFDMFMPGAKNP